MTEITPKGSNPQIWVFENEEDPNSENKYYQIRILSGLGQVTKNILGVDFQEGPIQSYGINGVQNEDLLKILIHRLQVFQKGKFSCRENAIAITKMEEALMWLNKRTEDRKNRNVEGKYEV